MTTVRSCAQLLEQFPDAHKRCTHTVLCMKLNPSDHRDVYNISAPFVWENETLLLGRIELRDNENSETLFFTQHGDDWVPLDGYESLKVQDPSFSRIGGMLVIAVVQTYDDPIKLGKLTYRTIFYRGKSPKALTRFAQGPEHMKDIRLLELDENRILVFTRPEGNVGGRGTIGYTIISSLDELNPWSIESARLLDQQFIPEEWGGANELHLLKNGKVGVLLELLCETDFVARTEDFKRLAHEVAMQIAAMNPKDVAALLKQDYIRDGSVNIETLIKQTIGKLGENIVVKQFTRFEI